MSNVNPKNYFTVQGWMITELGLKGNELMVYAIIYGFTQFGDDHKYNGGLQYLADWTNSTKEGIRKCVNSLVEKGLLLKYDVYVNNVKFCEYKAVDGIQQNCQTYTTKLDTHTTKLDGGIQQCCINNINKNINNNIYDNKDKLTQKQLFANIPSKVKQSKEIQEIFDCYMNCNLVKHKELSVRISKEIEKGLLKYSKDEILESINNYAKVVHDANYFFDTVWGIDTFIRQDNALPHFLNDGEKWIAYQTWKSKNKSTTTYHFDGEDTSNSYNTNSTRRK